MFPRRVLTGSKLVSLVVIAAGVAVVPFIASAQTAAVPPAKQLIFVLPFAYADGVAAAPADLAKAACPSAAARVENVTPEDKPQVVSAISEELQAKFADKYTVQVGTAEAAAPTGATVVTGCITEMDGGNAKKRVVGAGMGASFLKAHVTVSRMVKDKRVVLEESDQESKGRNFGVGSGMLINAMRSKRTSLAGDAGNLADKIAKDYEKHLGKEK